MHSSRIHAVRFSGRLLGGVFLGGVCQTPLWTDRRCENITLFQTSFSGGNYIKSGHLIKATENYLPLARISQPLSKLATSTNSTILLDLLMYTNVQIFLCIIFANDSLKQQYTFKGLFDLGLKGILTFCAEDLMKVTCGKSE